MADHRPEPPRWHNGYPDNLPAAAADAAEWLEFLAGMLNSGECRQTRLDDCRQRLAQCRRDLSRFLGPCSAKEAL